MADVTVPRDAPEKSGDPSDPLDLLSGRPHRDRLVPMVVTGLAILAAAIMGWGAWDAYMVAPWTRDGRVRAYLKIIAPEVPGKIVEMPVVDNQLVHKGDLLMTIDPRTYAIAVETAEAEVQKAKADMDNKIAMSGRREKLTSLSTTAEERQTLQSQALAATAAYHQAETALEKAKIDLEHTRIVSPVDGWVTNLLWQIDDYASVGEKKISIIDANSFWIDAYFEETSLSRINVDDPASIKLMGFKAVVRGHVEGILAGSLWTTPKLDPAASPSSIQCSRGSNSRSAFPSESMSTTFQRGFSSPRAKRRRYRLNTQRRSQTNRARPDLDKLAAAYVFIQGSV